MRGRVRGDYRLLCELGRGGMGVVYEAEQIARGRPTGPRRCRAGAAVPQRRCRRGTRAALGAANCYADLLDVGVELFETERDDNHALLVVIDERIVAVGSASFDMRGAHLDHDPATSCPTPTAAASASRCLKRPACRYTLCSRQRPRRNSTIANTANADSAIGTDQNTPSGPSPQPPLSHQASGSSSTQKHTSAWTSVRSSWAPAIR